MFACIWAAIVLAARTHSNSSISAALLTHYLAPHTTPLRRRDYFGNEDHTAARFGCVMWKLMVVVVAVVGISFSY